MEFESQICTTREQSERLLNLGLKKETADCQHLAYINDSKGKPIPKRNQKWFTRMGTDESIQVCGLMNAVFIPAWSLHRLIEIAGIRAFSPVSSLNGWYDDVIAQIQSSIHIGYIDEKYLNMDIVNAREEKNMELLKNN
jgi:hypothetical protein